jgi:hypothetical protein
MSSPPPSPPVEYADEVAPATESSPTTPSTTRTVAIIKTHALKHRFDIEPRILEASFEVKVFLSSCTRLEVNISFWTFIFDRLSKKDKWNLIRKRTRSSCTNCLVKTQSRWLSEHIFLRPVALSILPSYFH